MPYNSTAARPRAVHPGRGPAGEERGGLVFAVRGGQLVSEKRGDVVAVFCERGEHVAQEVFGDLGAAYWGGGVGGRAADLLGGGVGAGGVGEQDGAANGCALADLLGGRRGHGLVRGVGGRPWGGAGLGGNPGVKATGSSMEG